MTMLEERPDVATATVSQETIGAQVLSLAAGAKRYADLRRAIIAEGLLERARGFYYRRTSILAALYVAAVVAFYFWSEHVLGTLVAGLALGFAMSQLALVGHDAGHLAVFKRSRNNYALGQLCWSLALGVSFWWWRDRHNRHHASPNVLDDDPDLYGAGLIVFHEAEAKTIRGWRRWIVQRQTYVYPFAMALLGFAMRIEGFWYALSRLKGTRRVIEVALLVANIGFWVALGTLFGPLAALMFVVSNMFGGLYLAFVVAPNHKGMPVWAIGKQLSFLELQVLSSRNVAPHPIGDILFGGLNYQIEHHLFPNMPRPNLKVARDLVRRFCLEINLPYEEVGAITSYRQVYAELARIARVAQAAA